MSQHNTENIINKIVYAGETLIDLSIDTVTSGQVLAPAYFHLPNGLRVQGTCTFDADTSDATAQASEILSGKSAYVNGNKIEGSMPNRGDASGVISAADQVVSISQGYHDGSGTVAIDSTEQAKLIAGNIRTGVEILGVTGSYDGTDQIKATPGSATPMDTQQVILPSASGDYNYFTQFTVAPIPYVETQNAAGGYTATIGTQTPAA